MDPETQQAALVASSRYYPFGEPVIEIEDDSLVFTKGAMRVVVTASAYMKWKRGDLVQNAFPGLKPDERELLMTGATGAEWDEMFTER